MQKTGKFSPVYKPTRNEFEGGFRLATFGLIGAAFISEHYGYKTTVTDVKGNVSIEWIGERGTLF